jgi:hypothetical protein
MAAFAVIIFPKAAVVDQVAAGADGKGESPEKRTATRRRLKSNSRKTELRLC